MIATWLVPLLVLVLTGRRAQGAPTLKFAGKTEVPFWHRPCGGALEPPADSSRSASASEDELRASFRSLRMQHQLMLNDYLSKDYDFLYERVRIGVHEHQYIPNWLPGKHDVHAVKKLAHLKPYKLLSHLPRLHLDLQKFAVALEEMVIDETDSYKIQEALLSTQSYVKLMLCEVESSIVANPSLELPARLERDLMTDLERDPVDHTHRLVRDWGVLLKYKDYLHAWRHVFKY